MTTKDSSAFYRLLATTRERVPELLDVYRNTGPYRVRETMISYLTAQVQLGRLRALEPEVAVRQFTDLLVAEMLLKANFIGGGIPSDADIRQRVKEALECFLHGCGVKRRS